MAAGEYEPGTIISGKFRVERVLGRGGMGVVLVARHLELDQSVALKFLHAHLAWDAGIVERFLREARAAAKLRSDHVCRVLDVARTDDGTPYIVMELLAGDDLAAIARATPLAAGVAARYVLQACVALAEAHAAGIVHRDLKPANLFLAQRPGGAPIVKVLDFGIAKLMPHVQADLTSTTTMMGSPGYMSPEQLRSAKHVDVRTDIWALGVVLYELVQGHLPFRAETLPELSIKISVDPPEPLGAVDPAFAAIVTRCLEKEVARRYPSIAELAADLAKLAGPGAADTAAAIAELLGKPAVTPAVAPTLRAEAVGSAATVATESAPPATSGVVVATAAAGSTPPATSGVVVATPAASTASRAVPRRRRMFAGGLALGGSGLVALAVVIGTRTNSAPNGGSDALDAGVVSRADARPGPVDAAISLDAPAGFVRLPGGTFMMGSTKEQLAAARRACKSGCREDVFAREANVHAVTLSPFLIQATEVTVEQFASWLERMQTDNPQRIVRREHAGAEVLELLNEIVVMSANGSSGLSFPVVDANRFAVKRHAAQAPITGVTYAGASMYCSSAAAGFHGALPTEAQWEYAARGTVGRVYPWSDEPLACGAGVTCGGKQVVAVGSSKADVTPELVHDLGGNVAELVRDGFRDRYDCAAPCRDPHVPSASMMVVRGGDYQGPAWSMRAAERGRIPRAQASAQIGFRCVLEEGR